MYQQLARMHSEVREYRIQRGHEIFHGKKVSTAFSGCDCDQLGGSAKLCSPLAPQRAEEGRKD